MDCCKQNVSPRRKALISQFEQLLDQVESELTSYEDRGPSRAYDQEARGPGGPGPEGMGKLPDYMDQSKQPLTTNVQVDECVIDDALRGEPQMDLEYAAPTEQMRPDPESARYIEISTDHKCPPGYNEGARTVRPPAAASALDESPKACPESCTDILADQERRSRDRRQLEALPGDFIIEPKICPPGYPTGGMQKPYPSGPPARGQPRGMPGKVCKAKIPMEQMQYKQTQYKQGGMGSKPKCCLTRNAPEQQPGMAMGGARQAMPMGRMADPRMCPQKFSVGLSPDSSTAQDPRCAVDYQKCAPKRRPGVCGPSEVGTSLGYNPLGSREKTKSRELIGGVLTTGCDCVKRNGLQHDCKRTLCQGRPECLTNPPMCLPSGGPGCIPTSYFES